MDLADQGDKVALEVTPEVGHSHIHIIHIIHYIIYNHFEQLDYKITYLTFVIFICLQTL